MITRTYRFENCYAKPVNRGINLWNGSRGEIRQDNPKRWLDDLVYEAIGAEEVWPDGYDLKGIKVTIEVAEATRQ